MKIDKIKFRESTLKINVGSNKKNEKAFRSLREPIAENEKIAIKPSQARDHWLTSG
jgi:hypothetical protein